MKTLIDARRLVLISPSGLAGVVVDTWTEAERRSFADFVCGYNAEAVYAFAAWMETKRQAEGRR